MKTRLKITSPKTKKSVREIPLDGKVLSKLKTLSDGQERDAFILTGVSERFMNPRTYQNKFKRIQRKLGIKTVNFHVLRHTFSTISAKVGMNAKCLSEILGHSSVKISLDRYVHPTMEAKRQAISLLFPFAA